MNNKKKEQKVLGLDLGFHATGYYCTAAQGHFTPKGESRGARVNDFMKQVSQVITENGITDVFYELIDLDNAPKNNHSEASTAKLNGLGMALEAVCDTLNVRCYPVYPRNWKVCLFGYYYGKGNGYQNKKQVITKVKVMGYTPKTDDEADAIGIWYYGKNNVERLQYAKR